MPLYEPTVPARYMAPLLEILGDMGLPKLDGCLREAGLQVSDLHETSAPLTMAQFDALLRAIASQTGREDIGFDLGLQITSQHHGVLFAVLTRCATLEAMLQMLARYFQLITPAFSLQYRRLPQRGEFVWRPAAPMSPFALRVMEEIFAVTVQVQLGAVLTLQHPYDVYLSIARPAHADRYRILAPGRFHFGHHALPQVCAVFDHALLQTPLHWPQGCALSVPASADLADLQRQIPRTAQWSEWVTMMLREAEGCQPSCAQIADLLGVSLRTLARYLAAEGLAFRDIANRVRHQRACELLEQPGLTITQIAHRLGYDDSSNFSHAFRAQGGVTPRDYQASKRKTNDP